MENYDLEETNPIPGDHTDAAIAVMVGIAIGAFVFIGGDLGHVGDLLSMVKSLCLGN